jgi:hypothetical protein
MRVADQIPDGSAAQAAVLGLDLLLGEWFATNPDAGGLVRLTLSEDQTGLRIRAFGAAAPQPVDWGEVPAAPFAGAVTSGEAMSFTARYEFDFLTVLLAAYAKQGILVADTFNTFTDGSARADYFSREFFHR